MVVSSSRASQAGKTANTNIASSDKARSEKRDRGRGESDKMKPDKGKQKLKLLILLKILEKKTDAHQGLTMPQIIECLRDEGISAERKSLYSDIQTLRDAGYDIITLPTRPCQYAYVRQDLEFDEVMMLVDTVQSCRFLTNRKSNQLIKSLKSLVSDKEKSKLDTRVHVLDRIKNQSESVFFSVNKIHEAMQEKKKIEFLYFGYDTNLKRSARHNSKRYIVTPMQVVYANANYYLAAYDSSDAKVKIYRIDRMELLQKSTQDASIALEATHFELEDFDYQIFGMFQGDPAKVILQVDASVMDALVDEFGSRLQLRKSSEKRAEVQVKVQLSPQFFGWVAGLDGKVTIKAPKKVADQYRDWLQRLARLQ